MGYVIAERRATGLVAATDAKYGIELRQPGYLEPLLKVNSGADIVEA